MKRVILVVMALSFFALLTSCGDSKVRNQAIILNQKPFYSAQTTKVGSLFAVEEREGVKGLYLEYWSGDTSNLASAMQSEEIFTVENESLVELDITDFEVLDIIGPSNASGYWGDYFIFIKSNNKTYLCETYYGASVIFYLPPFFQNLKITEINYAKDEFGKYIYAISDDIDKTSFIDLDGEQLSKNYSNSKLYTVSSNYFDEEGYYNKWLFYKNVLGNLECEVQRYNYETIDIEGKYSYIIKFADDFPNINVKSSYFNIASELTPNRDVPHIIILTNNNRIINYNLMTHTYKFKYFGNINYWTKDTNGDYFAIVLDNKVEIYNSNLDLLVSYDFDFDVKDIAGITLEYHENRAYEEILELDVTYFKKGNISRIYRNYVIK